MIKPEVFKLSDIKEKFCLKNGIQCDPTKCEDWFEIDNGVGYCEEVKFYLRAKDKHINYDNIDYDSLVKHSKAVAEYRDRDECTPCKINKCVGWIEYEDGLGICVKDGRAQEKYTTDIVEGATNFMQIKRLWDATYNIINHLGKESFEKIEKSYGREELKYYVMKMMTEIIKFEREQGKSNFYLDLVSFVKLGSDSEVIDIDENFLILLQTFMDFGVAIHKFIFVMDLAEVIKKGE